MIGAGLLGETGIVSSFGAESAVLLHLVTQAAPDMPVLFLDTGKHFPETLAYRDELAAKLKLNIVNLTPDPDDLAAKDATELRWSYDPDGCCEIRKVKPLEKALADFDTSITGRKGFQSVDAAGPRALRTRRRHRPAEIQPARQLDARKNSTHISRCTTCRATLSRPKAIPRSAARRARQRSSRAKIRARAAGAAGTRPNAASTAK